MCLYFKHHWCLCFFSWNKYKKLNSFIDQTKNRKKVSFQVKVEFRFVIKNDIFIF